jgi:hypothetical protein
MAFFDHKPRPTPPPAPVPVRLPPADDYGNHWLGPRPAGAPAILKAGRTPELCRLGAPRDRDRWFVTVADARVVLTRDGKVAYFDSAEAALRALREAG